MRGMPKTYIQRPNLSIIIGVVPIINIIKVHIGLVTTYKGEQLYGSDI